MIYIFGKILKDKEQLTVGKLTIITNIIFIWAFTSNLA